MKRALLFVILCSFICCFFAACHESWRNDAPPIQSRVAVRIPAYEHRTLGNKLQVYIQSDAYLPMLNVQLVVRAGEAAVPPQQAGLMRVLYEMLVEDAELAREMDTLGASLQLHLRPDGAALEATVAAADGLRVVQLLAHAVREPRLDEERFARVRQRRLAAVFSERESALQQAANALRTTIYGPEHPLARSGRQTVTALSQLRLADVSAAYQRFIGPQNVALVLAGRVPPVVGFAWAQKYLSDWSAVAETAKVAPPLPAKAHPEVLVLPVAGYPGTLILLGGGLELSGRADEAALRTAIRLLQINANRRLRMLDIALPGSEVETTVASYGFGGHFTLSAVVRPERTSQALAELSAELTCRAAIYISGSGDWRMLANQMEFGSRLNALTLTFTTMGQISGVVHAFRGLPEIGQNAALLHLLRLPDAYYAQQIDNYGRLTRAEIERACSTSFGPDTVHIVLAGNPAVIEPQLRASRFGQVRRLTLD